MAKRKKTKKVYHRRKRSRGVMGAIGGLDLMTPIALIGGAAAGRYLANTILEKNTADAKNLYKAGIQIGAGIAAQMLIKKPMVHTLGSGMIAAGGLTLIAHLVPTLGAKIGDDSGSDILVLSGMDINALNGIDQIGASDIDVNTLNGVDQIGADDDDMDM